MRSILCAALLAAVTFGTSNLARSQTEQNALTAADAVSEALSANLDLQAARMSIDIARGYLLQSGRFDNPELELGYVDGFESPGERTATVGFAQRFPVTARLAREKNVARKTVEIAEAEVRDFVRTLIADVQSVFYTVRALDERLAVNSELATSVGDVERATARRLEVAEASPAEVSLLRIERLRLEQNAQRLIRERDTAVAALARLLGRNVDSPLRLVGELEPGPRSSLIAVPDEAGRTPKRPDLNSAARAIERADADRKLARAEVWEDWTLGLGYEYSRDPLGTPIGVHVDNLLTLGVKVPLPLWNRQQGRIAAAEAELRRSRRSRDALALRVREEIRVAEVRVRTLRTSVDAYATEILPEANRSQETFGRGYGQGLVGIAELLQAQRQYNESRAFYVELLGDLRQATIALEAASASSPLLKTLMQPGGMP